MAIQMRRGEYDDFDASKMLAGELAVVVSGDPETEGGALYVATAAGSATRVAFANEIPGDATTTSDGLMSAADKAKLDGVAAGAQANVIESISVNGTAVDVNNKNAAISIPQASSDSAGLMTASDKTKLDGIEAGANAYTLPAATTAALGGVKPDGMTVTVDNDGTIHATGSGTIPDGSITGVKIADDTIPDAKLAQAGGVLDTVGAISTPKNLFDKNDPDTTFGKYYAAGGSIATSAQYGSSQLIPVKNGVKYTASFTGLAVNWYDANGDYVTNTAGSTFTSQGYVTPPTSSCVYARFGYQTANVDSFWVHEEAADSVAVPQAPIGIDRVTFSEPKNLFDIDADNDMAGYTNTSGVHQSSTTLGQTDFIPVTQGYFYTTPILNAFVLWFDSSKTLIGSETANNFTYWGKVRPIANASYVKFIFMLSQLDSFYVHSDKPADQRIADAYLPETIAKTLPLEGLTWVSFGDSITAQGKWQPYVIADLGMEHDNCGIGSTPLSGSNANAFWQDARLNAVKAYDPDIVTILGGANDLTDNPVIGTDADLTSKDTDTFIGAYSYIIDNLLTWKPSLRIIILTTTWAHNDGTSYSQTVTYGQFAEACRLVAKYYHLPVVDLYANSGFNQYTMRSSPYNVFSDDAIHPNTMGAKVIASQVIAKMREVMLIH